MDVNAEGGQLLQKLSETLSLEEPLVFDENGVCLIVLDEKMPLIFELNETLKAVIVNLILGKLKDDKRVVILERLMKANYYWAQTEGATLGLDDETQLISLFYRFPLPLQNCDFFTTQVERMVNIGEYWVGELNFEDVQLEGDLGSGFIGNLKA